MLKISKQQINERWDATPEILRESLCSFENGKIIWQIGKKQHLYYKKKMENYAVGLSPTEAAAAAETPKPETPKPGAPKA